MAYEESSYSDSTVRWLSTADIGVRKRHGQYMTPAEVAGALVSKLGNVPHGAKVLDPAAGTGELLKAISLAHPNAELCLSGWEIDESVAHHGRMSVPSADFTVCDALNVTPEANYDIVIGNPPFYEFSPNETIRKAYADVISGRVNIYGLFFKVGLEALKPGGVLAYIVPPSMNTGAYFENLRDYILRSATIEKLEIVTESHLFDQAHVTIQMIILRKRDSRIKSEDVPHQSPHHYTYIYSYSPDVNKTACVGTAGNGDTSTLTPGQADGDGFLPKDEELVTFGENFHTPQRTPTTVPITTCGDTANRAMEENPVTFRKQIFCESSEDLQKYFTAPHMSNLYALGYIVKTGTIAWNNNKDILSNNFNEIQQEVVSKGTIETAEAGGMAETTTYSLLWAKDISHQNTLALSDKVRYRYITPSRKELSKCCPETGPAILVNRIVGAVKSPKVKFALVSPGIQFFAENHINVIMPNPNCPQYLTVEELHLRLSTAPFANILPLLTGSTQLSSKELNFLLQIPTATVS